MSSKIGLNGFNVASKLVFRQLEENISLQIVHVNCTFCPQQLADFLKNDEILGEWSADITFDESHIFVNGRPVVVTNFAVPNRIPWESCGVSTVLDFGFAGTSQSVLEGHLSQGVRRVLLCEIPAENTAVPIVAMGLNELDMDFSGSILSVATPETVCAATLLQTLDDGFGVVRALMHTVAPDNQSRFPEMRLSHSTAVRAVQQILPTMHGLVDGSTTHVVTDGSGFVEITAELHQHTTAHDVREHFQRTSQRSSLLDFSAKEAEKRQILQNPCAALLDAPFTKVIEENFVQIAAWYDFNYSQAYQILKLLNYLKEIENC